MALTNGSDHSDYQVRTRFVLFAPNPASCRPDKEGRASHTLSFPLIEDRRVLLIGTLPVLIEPAKGLKREPPSMKPSEKKYQEFCFLTFEMCQLDSWFVSSNCFPAEFQPLCVSA